MQLLSAEWFSFWLRAAVPVGSTIVLVTVTNLPMSLGLGLPIAPMFALMAVYYWSMRRPELMRAPAIFLIGFLQDALSGAPLGMSSMALLSAITFTGAAYQVLSQFRVLFFLPGFIFAALIYGIVAWLIAMLYYQAIIAIGPIAQQVLLSLLVYPVAGLVLSRIAKILAPFPVYYR